MQLFYIQILSGFELTYQKCIVRTFCRKIGGNEATAPRLGHLRKIVAATYAKNTHNIRKDTHIIRKDDA